MNDFKNINLGIQVTFCVSNGNICSKKCMAFACLVHALCMPFSQLLHAHFVTLCSHKVDISNSYPIHSPCPCACHFLCIFRSFCKHFPNILHNTKQEKQSNHSHCLLINSVVLWLPHLTSQPSTCTPSFSVTALITFSFTPVSQYFYILDSHAHRVI